MKHIKIKSIHMVNFRGFKDKTIEFGMNETNIRGMNATGKSTVMTAFTWLMFGKDQFGRTNFEIKPLTETGEPIHQVDSEVTAEIIISNDPAVEGEKIILKKVFHEQWVKPKGKAEAVFNGHETLYFFNSVPVTMREYNAKIESICPENLFKLLTNPLQFPNMNWQEQRRLLFDMAGTISDEEIASQSKAWIDLFKTLNAHKTMDEYRREIASEKRKIRDDLDKIPARIDEVHKSIPDKEEDWGAIEKAINQKSAETKAIDKEISDISASMEKEFEDYRARQTEINKKKSALQNIEYEVQKDLNRELLTLLSADNEKKGTLKNFQAELERLDRSANNLNQERQKYINEREELRKKWHELNEAREVHFLDEEFICPTCRRPLDDSDIEAKKITLTARYNEDKAKKLARNVSEGKELTARIDNISKQMLEMEARSNQIKTEMTTLESEIETRKIAIAEAEKDQTNWKDALDANVDYQRTLNEIQKLNEALGAEPKRVNITDQTTRKETIQAELKDLIQRLNSREFINRAQKRIGELKAEQKLLAQQLADLEKIEYNIQGFIRAKIEAVENKVNSMFSMVRFKMFNHQVNGEEAETCELMIDGVPFTDLNNAARINGGSDIIKTLSRHYGISCPIFTDNAEAVNEIIPMDAQTIKLYVTTDKKLIISN